MGKKRKKNKSNAAIAEQEEDAVGTSAKTVESEVSDELSDVYEPVAAVNERDDIAPDPIEVRDEADYPAEYEEESTIPVMVEQKSAFLITKKQLHKIMAVANLIVWKAAAYTAEGQFLFHASENALTIRATNNSISLKKHVEVFENSGEAQFTVNAKKLFALVNGLPDGLLRFSVDNLMLTIMSEDRAVKHTILCMAADQFPVEPERPTESDFMRVPCEIMKKIIDKTHKMISRETFKPVLRGVYFKRTGEKLTAVSTDGKRLALIEKVIGGDKKSAFDCIIDGEFLKTAYPVILGNYSSTMQIAVSGSKVFILVGGFELSGELVEGIYPNYKQVIPKDHDNETVLSRADLTDALKFVSPMISDIPTKKVSFVFSENNVTIKAFNPECGESERMLPCSYAGTGCDIDFNYTYLLDVLSCIDGDNVCMKFTNDEVPASFHDTERKDYFYVAMPLRKEKDEEVETPADAPQVDEASVTDTIEAPETAETKVA